MPLTGGETKSTKGTCPNSNQPAGVILDAIKTLSDDDIRSTITTMGADNVTVSRVDGTLYVSIDRKGGCGRMHANVCNFLRKKFQELEIVVLESPRLGNWCYKARKREPGEDQFSKMNMPVMATAERLGAA